MDRLDKGLDPVRERQKKDAEQFKKIDDYLKNGGATSTGEGRDQAIIRLPGEPGYGELRNCD